MEENREGLIVYSSPPSQPGVPYPAFASIGEPFHVLYKRYADAMTNLRKTAELIAYAKLGYERLSDVTARALARQNLQNLERLYDQFEGEAQKAADSMFTSLAFVLGLTLEEEKVFRHVGETLVLDVRKEME